MTRTISMLCLLLSAAVILGCGAGSSNDAVGDTTASRSNSNSDSPTTVESEKPEKGAWGVAFGAEGEDLGIILYDLSGHTLYTFDKDRGTTSTCYGACAKSWPPALTEGKPKAGGAASPGKVGSTKRNDGTVQLTYAGHPLYTYAPDRQADTGGDGMHAFGGEWSAIRPNGERP